MIFTELISSVKNSKNVAVDEIWELIEKISEASVNSIETSRALMAIELIEKHMSVYGITEKSFGEYFDILFEDLPMFATIRKVWSQGLINVPSRPLEDFISQILKYDLLTQAFYLLPELIPESVQGKEETNTWTIPKTCDAIKTEKAQGKKKSEIPSKEDPCSKLEYLPLKEEFIELVPKLLDLVYKGDYPYKNFYDPDWLRSQISDPHVYFRVFWDRENKQLIGFTYHFYNPVTKGLYLGSTVVHPAYQSLGVLTRINPNWMAEILGTFKPNFLWGEIRACDCRMQKFLESMGFKPVVFLLDFDTGMGERESEIVMVRYLKDGEMAEEVKTLPEVKPLANYVLRNFGIKRKFVYITPDAELVDSIFKFPQDFQFQTHYFPKWDGKLELKLNADNVLRVQVNEKNAKKLISVVMGKSRVRIEVNDMASSARILCSGLEIGPQGKILLNWLDLWLRLNKLLYIDAFVSSTEPFVQSWFLQNKWICSGYFPLFFPNVLTSKPEDAVVFRFPTVIRTRQLALTEKSLELCKMIVPESNFSFAWNEEHRFATLLNRTEINTKGTDERETQFNGNQ